jgi:hypothetical protein
VGHAILLVRRTYEDSNGDEKILDLSWQLKVMATLPLIEATI